MSQQWTRLRFSVRRLACAPFYFRRVSMDEFMDFLLVSGMLDENIEKSLTNNEALDDDIAIDENDDDF